MAPQQRGVAAGVKARRKVRSDREAARGLQSLNRLPDAIIDVGVRWGTPWLYKTYPGVPFVLVDPQRGGADLLRSQPENFTFLNKAAGAKTGRLTLNEQGAMSTFLERTVLTQTETKERYDVEVVTLDDIIAEHLPQAKRIGLKLDTEGFELEVLAGLDAYAARIDFIVSEASVLDRFENAYNFSDLVAAMRDQGFRFYNLLGRALQPAPRVYDCIFLRANDPAFAGRPKPTDA